MHGLRGSDMRAALGFVGDTHALAPSGDFRLQTAARLRTLVPSDMVAWVETRTGGPEAEAIASPYDLLPDGPQRFARIRNEHPILAHFERSRRGGAVKLSDFFGRRHFHRQRLYQEFFRPAGIEHQISIALPSPAPRLVRITLNRARGDFGERDRQVLNLVRPHVARAWENARAFARLGVGHRSLERAAHAAHLGIAMVRRGRAEFLSPLARMQLATYFPATPAPHRRLPDAVIAWLDATRRPRETRDLRAPGSPLLVDGDGGRLEIRSFLDDGSHVLIFRERPTRIAPRALESLGLSRRQAEVLAWLAEGKANPEIASILAISPHTVARHVEAIFERLGVQTRTAAAAAAFAHVPGW